MIIRELTKEKVLLVKEKIEQALWEIGLRVEMAEIRDRCAAAGAEVRGDRVHFSPEVLNRLLALAPKTYEIRSPYGKSWTIGDGNQYMAGIVIDPWINGAMQPDIQQLRSTNQVVAVCSAQLRPECVIGALLTNVIKTILLPESLAQRIIKVLTTE